YRAGRRRRRGRRPADHVSGARGRHLCHLERDTLLGPAPRLPDGRRQEPRLRPPGDPDRLLQRAGHPGRDRGAGARHHGDGGPRHHGRDRLRLLPDQAPADPVLVMAAPLIEVTDLWKSFDGTPVLCGVSLTVGHGETLVVMGGSGSGKTVLLRCIAGLLRPDAGRIRLFGVDITRRGEEELLPIRRRVGFVFQGAALFDSLTVHENVAFPLREHTRLGEEEIRKRVEHFLSLVGLDREVLPLLPAELSGGMRKRVGIARALAMEPEVMLYEAPTAGLDPTNAKLVADLISRFRAGVCDTSIVVTHDLELTRTVADRAAILVDGRFAVMGPLDE